MEKGTSTQPGRGIREREYGGSCGCGPSPASAGQVGHSPVSHPGSRRWTTIDQVRCRLDDLRAIVSADRLTAAGMVIFDSIGYREDGTPYDRPGRGTVVFGRSAIGVDWVAQHTHFSLFYGVPPRSFGNKPEKRAV